MINNIKTNKAFTLIEVLIVTAIISLVASIVNAQMSEARQKADDAHMKTEVQQVRTAVEQYRQKTGTVPLASGGNYTAGNNTYVPGEMAPEDSDEYRDAMNALVEEGLLPEIPTSPSGQSYSYLATTDGEEAVFAATLNNEDPGSNANSCEVVGGGGVSNCQLYTGTSYLFSGGSDAINPIENCGQYFDPGIIDENSICWAEIIYTDFCTTPVYPNCTTVPTGDYPQEICDYYISGDPVFIDGFGWVCGGYSGPIGSQNVWVCESETSVCSGSSNSDYCSCI